MFQKLADYPLLYVEILFPKTLAISHRIQHGYEEADIQDTLARGRDTIFRSDDEMEVKPGLSWSQQLGVAVSVMVEKDRTPLVEWIKTVFGKVIIKRKEILRQRDMEMQLEELGVGGEDGAGGLGEKIVDFDITGENEDQTVALQKCTELRLLLRQLKCVEGEEGKWVIPAEQPVEDLELNVQLLDKFVADPLAPNGKSLSDLLRRRKQAQKRKQRPALELEDEEQPRARKKRAKKVEERNQYKSEQFIVDSDEDDEATVALFFQRETELRARISGTANKDNIVPIHELTKSLKQSTGNSKTPRKQKLPGNRKRVKNPLASQMSSETDDAEKENPREAGSRKISKKNPSLLSDDSGNESITERRPSPLDDEPDTPGSQRLKRRVVQRERPKHSLYPSEPETDDADSEIDQKIGGGKRKNSSTLLSDDSDNEAIEETRSEDGLLRSSSPDLQPKSQGSQRAKPRSLVAPDRESHEDTENENEKRPPSPFGHQKSRSHRADAISDKENDADSDKENGPTPTNGQRKISVPRPMKRRTLAVSDRDDDNGSDQDNEIRQPSTDLQHVKRQALAVSDDDGSEEENGLFNKRRSGRTGSSLVAAGRIIDSSDEE